MTLRRPHSVRIVVRVVIVLAVVGAIATAAVAATTSHPTTYRTAPVARADVDEELHETGTIAPVSQATIAFPISGTVANVAVKVGQAVATGQTLATLDTATLQAALTKAEATLAAEELTLHEVLNGEPVSGNGSSPSNGSNGSNASKGADATTPTTPTTAASSAGSGGNDGTSGSGDSAAVSTARRAVQQAEQRVHGALVAAQTAMARATTACSGTTTTSTTSTSTTSSTTPSDPPTDPPADCARAQAAVLHDLQTVASSEQALAKAESTLSALLASNGSSGASPKTPQTTATTTPASSSVTYTTKQIAAYEAAVAAAVANVTVAQQNLAQATIVSPIAGTVENVTLSTGTVVSAASSTANITVVGAGGFEVSTSVTIAQRAKLAVGDTATIVPDGSSTELTGRVVSIGAVESTSNNTSSYAVMIGFTGTPTGLRNGASAAVTIVVAHTAGALTVPTSAVQTVGSLHTVTVIANGKATLTRVQIGTVGSERTVVTSGLRAGQAVSIANVGAAIPSSNTSSTSRGFGSSTFGSGAGPTIQRFGK